MSKVIGDSADGGVPAISGENTAGGDGVIGKGRRGVVGLSNDFQGVFGKSVKNAGVVGESDELHGVYGDCHNPHGAGVYGTNDRGGFGVIGVSTTGVGVSGKGGRLAGLFEGDVEVTGKIHCPQSTITCFDVNLTNADCAEDFDVIDAHTIEPGTVMVLGNEGALHQSHQAYDKRVAGVVSGAGNYKPGIVLDKQPSQTDRKPIALLGKVYCKADAQCSPIEVGDLLTTSATPGHAMRASDQSRAFGAVIGKALRPLRQGQGLIPILIALQ